MLASSHLLNFYNRSDVKFTAGEGVYLYCDNGGKYLDFASGIAVNSLGHCPPDAVKILQQQAEKLWHTSNLYTIDGMEEFAKLIAEKTFADSVFFANSGAEVLELAIKIIRQYAYQKKPSFSKMGGDASNNTSATNHNDTGNDNKPYRIITFKGCFHGRTNGAIAASGSDRMLSGFHPALPGFDIVPFGDAEAVEQAITEETAGIIIEPIQGEGGINVADFNFLKALRNLCDKHDLVLCYDEVQCGMGRTGHLLGYQSLATGEVADKDSIKQQGQMATIYDATQESAINPDVACLAKGIGSGFPLAAFLTNKKLAKIAKPGMHGSTYGGNPLAIAVGRKVFEIISDGEFLKQTYLIGMSLSSSLEDIAHKYPKIIEEVRGKGLMQGLKISDKFDAKNITEKLQENKLLTVPAMGNVIRILPPLTISEHHVKECHKKMLEVFEVVSKSAS